MYQIYRGKSSVKSKAKKAGEKEAREGEENCDVQG